MASRFSKETAICMVERWNKGMGYCFVPECNHAKESHTCQFFFVSLNYAVPAEARFVAISMVT